MGRKYTCLNFLEIFNIINVIWEFNWRELGKVGRFSTVAQKGENM